MVILGCNNINELKNASIIDKVTPIYSCKIIEPSGAVFIHNFCEDMLEKVN